MPTTDSASSAVRNLNDYEVMGRKLRVDFSNEQKGGEEDPAQVNNHLDGHIVFVAPEVAKC